MKQLLVIALFLIPSYSAGAIVVQGNQTAAPYAFKTTISSKTYDTTTGTFYVGLANGTDNYTIAKAPRPTFVGVPSFSPVLIDSSSLKTDTIEFLAFSNQQSTTVQNLLIAVPLASGSSAFSATTVTALFTDDSIETTSSALNDAGGTSATSGIVQIAANKTMLFAAVSPNGSTFGNANTGIAMVGIGAAQGAITLTTKNASTGLDGNQAALLDDTSTFLKGTSGGDNVVFNSTPSAALYWDDPMQRLFIGLSISSGSGVSDIAKSVVVANVTNGALNFEAITPDSAISSATDEIIVGQGASISFQPTQVRVLHASTGPDYLIVNTAQNSVTNRIFALPLVNDTSNPSSSLNGTLAQTSSTLNSSYKFVTPATNPGDLAVNNETTNPQALVGAGDLPIPSTTKISDMVVIDDGVYISINDAPTSSTDTGIWYSQALFGSDGKILRWTPWAKRIIPINAFPGVMLPGGATHNGAVIFLQVDAKAGNVWLVEGTTGQTVGITSWNTGQQPTDLLTQANAFLSTGCYAGLDLNQATRGFLGTTPYRYALFGGTNKVVFAVTSIASDMANPSSPQSSITDYTQAENLFSTLLPDKAGNCLHLEYSRTSTTADNNYALQNYCFFFAGTENGLFVFSTTTGEGFNPINLSTLTQPPFSTGAWYQMATIPGPIVDIKTSGDGHTLYVITSGTSKNQPMSSMLYSIPFTDNTNTMFAPSNVNLIAQTQTGAFASVVQFYGVQIVATDDPYSSNPADKEQLILATNQGLFASNASQVGSASIATVTNQTDAHWQVIGSGNNATAKTAFYGIAQADTPIRQTTWPFSIEDQSGFGTFNAAAIHQFSGNGDISGSFALFNSSYLPLIFNANPSLASFSTLFPIIYFYSDGGRRFLIYNNSSIGLQPFYITPWNVTQPYILSNPTLAQVTRFFWLNQIGATGILMAGTGSGIVGLD